MKALRITSFAAGLALPIVLTLFEACQRGMLWFLRGKNAYITVHGNSWDYNNNAWIDWIIVAILSGLLLAVYFYIPKPQTTSGYITPLFKIIGLLIALYVISSFVGFSNVDRCGGF